MLSAALRDADTFAAGQPAQRGEVRSRWTPEVGLAEYAFGAETRLPDHGHPWASVNWTLEGTMTDRFGSRSQEHRPGTAGFHPPGTSHRVRVGPAGGRAFHVEVGARWAERTVGLGPLEDRFLEPAAGPALDALSRLRTELWLWDASSAVIVEGLALQLLGLLQRGGPRPSLGRPAWIDRAVERLRESDEHVTVSALAEELGESPAALARLFRRHVGQSVGEFGLRSRLRRAHLLLTTSDRTIADIAHELGFADHAHLTRRFKRRYGVPPSRLREK